MSEFPKIEEKAVAAAGWVKTHVAWSIGLAAFVLGAVIGHFLHL